MKKAVWFVLGFSFLLPLACKANPQKDPQTIAKIEELKQELSKTRTDVAEAQKKESEYSGGLIKALIGTRIEILRTNEALLQQRINALESGASIKIEVLGTTPNEQRAASLEQEIQTKRLELAQAKKEMEQFSGGLVLAMKASSAATMENTIAMLEQERLFAKYGIFYKTANTKVDPVLKPQVPVKQPEATSGSGIVSIRLFNKRFAKEDYTENIWFDLEWTPIALKKPARSIKGVIEFCDLFGETKFRIGKTLTKPLKPGEPLIEKGVGFEYNQFKDEHMWVRGTDIKDMTFRFQVTSILYEDGEREDY